MINPEQLQTNASRLRLEKLDEETVRQLRQDYPELHFTYCLEDDIPNHEPMIQDDNFSLFMVDSREHCLCLTRNYELATGIVVAEVIHA
jgi:hypothetical protein